MSGLVLQRLLLVRNSLLVFGNSWKPTLLRVLVLYLFVKFVNEGVTPESMNPSVEEEVDEEEEGLPSPPLDMGALFAQPTSMELSQVFTFLTYTCSCFFF